MYFLNSAILLPPAHHNNSSALPCVWLILLLTTLQLWCRSQGQWKGGRVNQPGGQPRSVVVVGNTLAGNEPSADLHD